MTDLIDAKRVMELLEQIVEEKGADHVAPKFRKVGHRVLPSADVVGFCVYRDPQGEPSCIVGQVLHKLNLLPSSNPGSSWSASSMLPQRAHFTYEANEILQHAQSDQDSGSTRWGAVLINVKLFALEKGFI